MKYTLKNLFENHIGDRFLFIKPGGNWGDHLIYTGAEHLAEQVGVSYHSTTWNEIDSNNIGKNDIVYLHGGGGFNSWCSGAAGRALMKAASIQCKLIIQGPSTIDNKDNYISNFFSELSETDIRSPIVFFAREEYSLNLLEKHSPDFIDLNINDDTALFVSSGFINGLQNAFRTSYDLLIIREDNEAQDVIKKGITGRLSIDPALFCSSFDHWLRVHAYARSIITNRTHSAIAGALFNIPTTILPCSYHKNRSIWEYSLRDRDVEWGEYETIPKVSMFSNCSNLSTTFPKRVRESYKVKTICELVQTKFLQLNGLPIE